MDWRLGEADDTVSWEARLDWFARALLLPADALRTFVEQGRSASEDLRTTAIRAGSHFRVDMFTLARRLVDLGLCDWDQARVIRTFKTTKSDIIEFNLRVHDELAPPAMARPYEQAVLRLYRSETISGARAIELLRGLLDEEGLPDLPSLPETAIWSFT